MAEKKAAAADKAKDSEPKKAKGSEKKKHIHISKRLIFILLLVPTLIVIVFAMMMFLTEGWRYERNDKVARFALARKYLYEVTDEFNAMQAEKDKLEAENTQLRSQLKDNIQIIFNPTGKPEVVTGSETGDCLDQMVDAKMASFEIGCNEHVFTQLGYDKRDSYNYNLIALSNVAEEPMAERVNTGIPFGDFGVYFFSYTNARGNYTDDPLSVYLENNPNDEIIGTYVSDGGVEFTKIKGYRASSGVEAVSYNAVKEISVNGEKGNLLVTILDEKGLNNETFMHVVDTFKWLDGGQEYY